jgi:hypothetical protein
MEKEPRTGSVTSFNVIPPKQHLHGAMTVAAEILIAQPDTKIKKFYTKTNF